MDKAQEGAAVSPHTCVICGLPIERQRFGPAPTTHPGACRTARNLELRRVTVAEWRARNKGKGWTQEGESIVKRMMQRVRQINDQIETDGEVQRWNAFI
jgi:hypothetical protein